MSGSNAACAEKLCPVMGTGMYGTIRYEPDIPENNINMKLSVDWTNRQKRAISRWQYLNSSSRVARPASSAVTIVGDGDKPTTERALDNIGLLEHVFSGSGIHNVKLKYRQTLSKVTAVQTSPACGDD
ncbi:hypothetical protein J1614_006929 [Plenodomus biglobosus]|nr:hypothetical protein J1614_006929 [Plenodomus biglobosus]